MVTLSDVAKAAGVSSATVSRVVCGKGKVGDACRSKVQAVIDEMGYRPNSNARALASKKSDILGLITPNLAIPFHGETACGVDETARGINYKVLMSNSYNDKQTELAAIEAFRQQGCENIILHSKYLDDVTLIQLANDIPGLVIVNRLVPSIEHRCVWLDNVAGGYAAAKHMLNSGHKKLVIIGSSQTMSDPKDRMQGILKALADVDICVPQENIINVMPTYENAEKAIEQFLTQGIEFTGVIAFNDIIAIGAMNALFEQGKKVPEDIAVIGFDDTEMCRVCRPQLTTMNYPAKAIAIFGAQLSLALTNGQEAPPSQQHLYLAKLVERGSVNIINA